MEEGVAGPAMTITGAVGAAAGAQPALNSSRRIAVIVKGRLSFIVFVRPRSDYLDLSIDSFATFVCEIYH